MNYKFPNYALLALLLTQMNTFAQVDPLAPLTPAISLSGRSRITGVSASPRAESSGLPERYLRWEFEPSVSLFGLPVSARMLLTTENDPSRHAMNSVEVIFDVKKFQQSLRERVMEKAAEPILVQRMSEEPRNNVWSENIKNRSSLSTEHTLQPRGSERNQGHVSRSNGAQHITPGHRPGQQ